MIYAGIMPPLKKRKTAFWPCGSCRQNCKAGSICCDACRRWHHASCEGLNAADFKFFNESDAPYTCNDSREFALQLFVGTDEVMTGKYY